MFYWVYFYVYCHPQPSHLRVHGLVHGFATKLVVGPLVLHVVGVCECVHEAWLLSVACGTGVPIFHVKSTRRADILIGPRLCDVGIPGPLLMLHRRLVASLDVRYGGWWVDVRHHLLCYHGRQGCSGSTAATSTAATASTTILTMSSGGILGTP